MRSSIRKGGIPSENEYAGIWILDFLASKPKRNKHLVLKQPVNGILLLQPKLTKIVIYI